MSKPADSVIGIGANLGARQQSMQAAARALGTHCRVLGVSSLYETLAVGPPQPDYLNAAIRIEWQLSARELLDTLLSIELSLGRVRSERWGARTLDLDVLWIRALSINEPALQVPHPELCSRAFAVLPLLDLVPEAADPTTGFAYVSLLGLLDTTGVRRVAGPEWVD